MTDNADDIFGTPVLVWRDDPLFNQGHIAAELALAALKELESGEAWEESGAEHAIERLEVFLGAARVEAEHRASADRSPEGGDRETGRASPDADTSGESRRG